MKQENESKKNKIYLLTYITGIVAIFLPVISWYIGLVSLMSAYVVLAVFIFWFIVFISSFVYLLRHLYLGFKASISIFINIAIALLLIFNPLYSVMRTHDFSANLSARKKVISLIKTGKLKASAEDGMVALPSKYRYLSRHLGGKVFVNNANGMVAFYTSLGADDGIAYLPNDRPSSAFDEIGQQHYIFVKITDQWYWFAHY